MSASWDHLSHTTIVTYSHTCLPPGILSLCTPRSSSFSPPLVDACLTSYLIRWKFLFTTILFPEQYTRRVSCTPLILFEVLFMLYHMFEIKVLNCVYTIYAVIYNVVTHVTVTFALLAML